MKGSKKVIDALNALLTHELSSADQYFCHAYMYEDWGLNELFEHTKHEQEHELQHAAKIVQRILFLEGTPNVAARIALKIGKDVPEMLANDLDYEYDVAKELKKVIALCEKESDYVTRELLVELLDDTEDDHIYFLEIQLGLIEKMGLKNYIQLKTGTSPA